MNCRVVAATSEARSVIGISSRRMAGGISGRTSVIRRSSVARSITARRLLRARWRLSGDGQQREPADPRVAGAHRPVQVRAGDPPGRANQTDDGAALDELAFADVDAR